LDMADVARTMDRLEKMKDVDVRKEQRRLARETLIAQGLNGEDIEEKMQQYDDSVRESNNGNNNGNGPQKQPKQVIAGAEEGEDAMDLNTSSASMMEDDFSASLAATPTSTPSKQQQNPRRKQSKKSAKRAGKKGVATGSASSSSAASSNGTDNDDSIRGQAKGLSSLAQLCLGLPLDKYYQISAWRRRPLKSEQQHYAALDAYCLLGIHDAFFVEGKQLEYIAKLGLPKKETFIQGGEPIADAAGGSNAASDPSSSSAASTSNLVLPSCL
jgi:hypothetical protein